MKRERLTNTQALDRILDGLSNRAERRRREYLALPDGTQSNVSDIAWARASEAGRARNAAFAVDKRTRLKP